MKDDMDKTIIRENASLKALETRVAQLAEPFLTSENFELVQVQYISQEKEKIIRIFADKEGGITLDDCVYISRQLGDIIDIHLDNMPPYRLEVSSPGLRRPLNKKQDFYRFEGKKIKVQFQNNQGERKKITGILTKVDETSFIVSRDATEEKILDNQVLKATLAEG